MNDPKPKPKPKPKLDGEVMSRRCSTPGCEKVAILVTQVHDIAVCPDHNSAFEGSAHNLLKRPANIDAPVLEVVHADLTQVSADDAYRRVCPACLHGILPMRRQSFTCDLLEVDRCTSCGQRVLYTDCTVNGEWLTRSFPVAARNDTVQTRSQSEVGLVFGANDQVLCWHLPEGRTASRMPDDGALWRFLWDNRASVWGHGHLHPWYGRAEPSTTDTTTYAAIESGLGQRLLWYVATYDTVALVVWSRGRYQSFLLADYPLWVHDLRRGGTPDCT